MALGVIETLLPIPLEDISVRFVTVQDRLGRYSFQ